MSDTSGFWRLLYDLEIEMPALPQPTLSEVQKRQAAHREIESIAFDHSPIVPVRLTLGTLLRQGETSIRSGDYAFRRSRLANLLGFQHALWLEANQDQFPRLAVLPNRSIDWPGIELIDRRARRRFPQLHFNGRRLSVLLVWDGYGLTCRDHVARAAREPMLGG